MKVSKYLKDKETVDKAADLRAKLLYAFVLLMVAVILFWVLRLACVTKIGFWYSVWSVCYTLSRFLACFALLAIIAIWVYLFVMSIVFTGRRPGSHAETSSSTDTDTSIDDLPDLSNFD